MVINRQIKETKKRCINRYREREGPGMKSRSNNKNKTAKLNEIKIKQGNRK